MNRELVTYQTYESPKKTGGVVIGVSLLIIGLAIVTLYLVKESRKPDEDELRQLINGEPVPVSQAKATTVQGLLDELFAFGSGGARAGCTTPMACNYDPAATKEDGSCDYVSCHEAGGAAAAHGAELAERDTTKGCTISVACNYDPAAIVNDGSCDFKSCYEKDDYHLRRAILAPSYKF